MKRFLLTALLMVATQAWGDKTTEQLVLQGSIPLAGIRGRVDHLAIDPAGQRLFASAPGSNSVEVVDIGTSKSVDRIDGLPGPRGVAYLQGLNRLAVTCSGDGSLRFLDGDHFRSLAYLRVGVDANELDYDPVGKLLYAGGGTAIAVIDAARMAVIAVIDVGGHAAGIRVDSAGEKVYASVPSRRSVVVIDARSRSVSAVWPVGASENYGLALDESGDHLFVGCRRQASVVALSLSTGRRVLSLGIAGDVGDMFYDPVLRRLYLSCGAGQVNVYEWVNVDSYKRQLSMKTARGARTSLLVPGMGMFFVAVPAGDESGAEIRIYGLKPF